MDIYILFVVSLAASPALSQLEPDPGIMEIEDRDKDITDINHGLNLTQGDIMVEMSMQRNAIIDNDELWTSPVPYILEKDLEMNAKGVTLRAFEQFSLKSCFDFKPRDSEEYYISVQKLQGCFSYIGKVLLNGQVLSIGQYCDTISIVEHEFLHALGFYHEQSRHDRDDHVIIVFENIEEGREHNFDKLSKENSSTLGTLYDFDSVMHYGKNAFSNGNGSTIITKNPKYQDVIGQRLEMSPNDILKLNRLYDCNSTIAFKMYCGFSDEAMCGMSLCWKSEEGGWERVTHAAGGPHSDHTNLPSPRPEEANYTTASPEQANYTTASPEQANYTTASPEQANYTTASPEQGYFMHASTASGQEGDSSWLKTKRMSLNRACHVQCLQFYYYHSGSQSDELNIWIREFQDEGDFTGHPRLMGQITGPPTSHWQLHHVPLNATKSFQVEFEVLKGPGNSSGGLSIDDINLSETECPHLTWQKNDFENFLPTSTRQYLYSPRQYSSAGYAYQIAIRLDKSHFGLFVRLVSGDYDDQLQWPCPWRQVTFLLVDQNPNIQQQMSKQWSLTSDPTDSNLLEFWDNPRNGGRIFVDEHNETYFVNYLYGWGYFEDLDGMKSREFLKGGNAVFLFTFQDISPLVNGSSLPCPNVRPVNITHSHPHDEDPCASRHTTTTYPPPSTTEDNSIFGLSPGMVSSPVLILLAVVMFLTL